VLGHLTPLVIVTNEVLCLCVCFFFYYFYFFNYVFKNMSLEHMYDI